MFWGVFGRLGVVYSNSLCPSRQPPTPAFEEKLRKTWQNEDEGRLDRIDSDSQKIRQNRLKLYSTMRLSATVRSLTA